MGRNIQFDKEGLTLHLTGLTRFFAMKSSVRMPYSSIKHVLVDTFDAPRWMLRMPGTSIPGMNIYEGSYKYANEWYFLSYAQRVPLVIIELDGHEKYRYVIFQMDDPTRVAADIRQHLRKWRT
ncbi:hypothetical protein ACAF76_001030 [Brevibacillus sp. TJ4]|uniref:hypothetical protein n=1 Tax=Brevibacillus sp. TJ4 TaxID=3234853 RepID=UPI0037CD4C9C